MKKLRAAIVPILFNQLVVAIPVLYVFYRLMLWRGCSFGRQLPTFPRVVGELFIMICVDEIAFYYVHRFFHFVSASQSLLLIRSAAASPMSRLHAAHG